MGPVFRQTGHKYGPIDLALIGIGAYSPRKLLRSVHASPEEAVETAKAIGAKAILGMHWGTIELSEEEAFEPARRFTDAASREGYAENDIGYHPLVRRSLWMLLKSSVNSEQRAPKCPALRLTRLVDQLQCFD